MHAGERTACIVTYVLRYCRAVYHLHNRYYQMVSDGTRRGVRAAVRTSSQPPSSRSGLHQLLFSKDRDSNPMAGCSPAVFHFFIKCSVSTITIDRCLFPNAMLACTPMISTRLLLFNVLRSASTYNAVRMRFVFFLSTRSSITRGLFRPECRDRRGCDGSHPPFRHPSRLSRPCAYPARTAISAGNDQLTCLLVSVQ